jgi:hypothetical protein
MNVQVFYVCVCTVIRSRLPKVELEFELDEDDTLCPIKIK